jgi:hypothetical protein
LISNLASLRRKKRTFFRTLGNQMLDNTPGLVGGKSFQRCTR